MRMNINNNENTYSDRKLRLMELMRTLNLNQSQFAEKIEVKQSNVSEMLSGKRPIGRNIINKLVLAFDINKDWMLTGYGEMFDSSRVSNPFHLEDVDLNTNGVKDRLLRFIQHIGISTAEFERSIGVSGGYVSNISRSIQPDKLEVISKVYPNQSIEWLLVNTGKMIKSHSIITDGIDMNDSVSVELTEWGATFLNAANIFKNATISQRHQYKTDYKAGDIYQNQLWKLILDFKDGIRFDKEKAFNNLKKVNDE